MPPWAWQNSRNKMQSALLLLTREATRAMVSLGRLVELPVPVSTGIMRILFWWERFPFPTHPQLRVRIVGIGPLDSRQADAENLVGGRPNFSQYYIFYCIIPMPILGFGGINRRFRWNGRRRWVLWGSRVSCGRNLFRNGFWRVVGRTSGGYYGRKFAYTLTYLYLFDPFGER